MSVDAHALAEILHLAAGQLRRAGDARRGQRCPATRRVQRQPPAHPAAAGGQDRVEHGQVERRRWPAGRARPAPSGACPVDAPGCADAGRQRAHRCGAASRRAAAPWRVQRWPAARRGRARCAGAARSPCSRTVPPGCAGVPVSLASTRDACRPARRSGAAMAARSAGGAQRRGGVQPRRELAGHVQHRLPQPDPQPVDRDLGAEADRRRRQQPRGLGRASPGGCPAASSRTCLPAALSTRRRRRSAPACRTAVSAGVGADRQRVLRPGRPRAAPTRSCRRRRSRRRQRWPRRRAGAAGRRRAAVDGRVPDPGAGQRRHRAHRRVQRGPRPGRASAWPPRCRRAPGR